MTVTTVSAVAASLLFPGLMIFAGLRDLTTMRIANWLVIALFIGYAALAPLSGLGLYQIGFSAAVAMIAFVAALACFALGWIGGGDAKLLTVAVLWIGAEHAPAYILYMAFSGGVLTLILLAFRKFSPPVSLPRPQWLARLQSGETGVPYGVAIAAGALIVFPDTVWMMSLRP